MANLDDCADVLRRAGVTVHEMPNWQYRGHAGKDLIEHRGILWHHTATNRAQFTRDPAPTRNMCTYGRGKPGDANYVPGPLSQMLFDRNGHIWMLATGLSNHAGRGSAPGIPRDMGNHYLIGIESESSGIAPWDWTPAQLHWAPIIGAALESHYLRKLPEAQRLQLGHAEYSSEGKIDPAGWPGGMDGLRASINAVMNGSAAAGTEEAPAVPDEGENMIILGRTETDATVWAGDGITRVALPNMDVVESYQWMAANGWMKVFKNGEVQTFKGAAGVQALGQPLPTVAPVNPVK